MLKYGCRLAEGEICRGYDIAIDDPVAQLLSRYFCVTTRRQRMDHSPGELEGKIDHLSREAAVGYLLMPQRIKKPKGQVEVVASTLEELNAALKKIDRSVDDNLAPTLLSKRRSEIVEKYVPVRQPIAKRPPEGVYLLRLMWNRV